MYEVLAFVVVVVLLLYCTLQEHSKSHFSLVLLCPPIEGILLSLVNHGFKGANRLFINILQRCAHDTAATLHRLAAPSIGSAALSSILRRFGNFRWNTAHGIIAPTAPSVGNALLAFLFELFVVKRFLGESSTEIR